MHALDLALDRVPDTEIIARAVMDKRTIITADLDYPGLLALSRAHEPSLVLFRGGNWADTTVIERMGDILRSLTALDKFGARRKHPRQARKGRRGIQRIPQQTVPATRGSATKKPAVRVEISTLTAGQFG